MSINYLYDSIGVCAKVEVAEDKVRRPAVGVVVEALQSVLERTPTVRAVHRRVFFHSHKVGRVVEQVDVDQIEDCVADRPSGPQEALSRPLTLNKHDTSQHTSSFNRRRSLRVSSVTSCSILFL